MEVDKAETIGEGEDEPGGAEPAEWGEEEAKRDKRLGKEEPFFGQSGDRPVGGHSWQAFAQQQPLVGKVESVQIQSADWLNTYPQLNNPYANNRRKHKLRFSSPFDLQDARNSYSGTLFVINKQAGVVAGTIAISPRANFPNPNNNSFTGHFLPLGKFTSK